MSIVWLFIEQPSYTVLALNVFTIITVCLRLIGYSEQTLAIQLIYLWLYNILNQFRQAYYNYIIRYFDKPTIY